MSKSGKNESTTVHRRIHNDIRYQPFNCDFYYISYRHTTSEERLVHLQQSINIISKRVIYHIDLDINVYMGSGANEAMDNDEKRREPDYAPKRSKRKSIVHTNYIFMSIINKISQYV